MDLCVTRTENPGDVPGVLHEYVLESSSGAEEREVALAGELNGPERAVQAAVWATRRNPEAIDRAESRAWITDRIGCYPRRPGAMWQACQGSIESAMGGACRIVVADDCDRG
jgi:hypothetical protein